MLAYTGLETVANLAEEVRRPGRDLPRSLFSAIGAVVVISVLIALVGLSAFPAPHGTTALGHDWLRAPLMGDRLRARPHVPHWFGQVLRVYVGTDRCAHPARGGDRPRSPASAGSRTRSASTASCRAVRAAASPHARLAGVGDLPRATIAIVAPRRYRVPTNPVAFLASLFSFGVLLAFTAAQLAVIQLRFAKPDLDRPFRVPLTVRIRGVDVPVPSIVGALATAAIFVDAMATHIGARYGGPAWLARAGSSSTCSSGAVEGHRPARARRAPPTSTSCRPRRSSRRILVPMKLGEIGEEMVATAVKLAEERGGRGRGASS